MNASIIMPLFNYDPIILKKILKALKQQKFPGKYEVIKIDKGLGTVESVNYGIKKAKYEVIVTLHQDCIPMGNDWLSNLVEPLKDRNISASVSKVHLPEYLWKTLDKFAQAMIIKEVGEITPLMDEKGCAYRKEVLRRIGYFDNKYFRTSGGDFDMYMKLIKEGKIAYPSAVVLHIHPTTWNNRLKKTYQNANGYGALVRIHGTKMIRWYAGMAIATPILGLISLLVFYPWKKARFLGLHYAIIAPLIHAFYAYGFWKGFLERKQTV